MNASATSVVIVGAGFGGIAAAIELRGNGITDVTIVDAAPGIGGSIILYLEAQSRYVRMALQETARRDTAGIEVRKDVEAASDRELQDRFPGTAWTRCDSWYRDEGGRIVTNWPGYMREYLAGTANLDADEYVFHR